MCNLDTRHFLVNSLHSLFTIISVMLLCIYSSAIHNFRPFSDVISGINKDSRYVASSCWLQFGSFFNDQ